METTRASAMRKSCASIPCNRCPISSLPSLPRGPSIAPLSSLRVRATVTDRGKNSLVLLSELGVHHPVEHRVDTGVHVQQPSRQLVKPLRELVQLPIQDVDQEVRPVADGKTDEDGEHHLGESDLAAGKRRHLWDSK